LKIWILEAKGLANKKRYEIIYLIYNLLYTLVLIKKEKEKAATVVQN